VIRIVFLGDIVAKPGRKALHKFIPKIKEDYKPDFIIANGENASGGLGITPSVVDELLFYGIDFITTGNHIWKHKEINDYLDNKSNKIIRPINYPISKSFTTPGVGFSKIDHNKYNILVINVLGRTFTQEVDCPFSKIEHFMENVDRDKYKIILVDFHAETSSEKVAMGWFLNGKVSAVVGTHTHVQTADERILDKGTAYISDLGMCGSMDTVIGVDRDIIIKKFLTCRPISFKYPEINLGVNGVVIDIDEDTGIAKYIKRINIREN
jgi:2',3'-cyclic-nucleotide 2'-phosphodiesterase